MGCFSYIQYGCRKDKTHRLEAYNPNDEIVSIHVQPEILLGLPLCATELAQF